MYRYQSSGRSLTLTPESHRWADKIAYLNAQQLYSKNAAESTPAPPLYNKSFFNNYPPNPPKKDTKNIKKKLCATWYVYLALLLTGMVSASMAMSIYSLLYVQKTTTIDVPIGTIVLYGGNAQQLVETDNKWLFCDGSAVSRSTYSALFLVIGITYGIGNGLNTFNLPDFRARFPLGSLVASDTSLISGGNASHTLTTAELPTHYHDQDSLMTSTIPAHSHAVNDPGHDHGGSTGSSTTSYLSFGGATILLYTSSGSYYATSSTHTHTISTDYTNINLQANGNHSHTINGTTGSTGMGQSFNVTPPYQTIHCIIRANL
ncbi:unnamed protein product [Adineta ricciae]|uniref:Phage tail collar domain-containing protein n=1 Tax=Adineta ricciae TaxID=249248 RepID=A0A814Z5L0_ADIRI|nr:unnamed protein product [Adineta ricciae]CAF1238482.1 unnamed protein product [Adineta ricciae]